jgi:hypothetical protein
VVDSLDLAPLAGAFSFANIVSWQASFQLSIEKGYKNG